MLLELLFENLLHDLTPPELAGVLSVCIYERNDDVTLTNAHFIKIQHEMIEIVERIGQLEKDCGLSEESIMTKEKNIRLKYLC